MVQRQVLYLGEINDSQRAAWCRSIEVVEGKSGSRLMALFPEDREAPALDCVVVKIDIAQLSLQDPRQWGACWAALFEARFDVPLYDLTSTYFESDPPFEDKRRFGYSRDRRPDCVQVVIALIVTPEGFPLGYEAMPGNTAEQSTLAGFVEKIERQYGRSERIWIMDRGIPSEETLAAMRQGAAPLRYLVGTPKGRLMRLEAAFLGLPWQEVRRSVDVKLLTEDGELDVLVRSEGRMLKERGMRRRRLKTLWRRLSELQGQSNGRDRLMLKLGAAKKRRAGPGPGRHPPARDRGGTRRQRLLVPPAARPAAPGSPAGSPRASSSRPSPPSRWSTCTCPPPTAGTSSCRAIPGRTRSTSCCCTCPDLFRVSA